MDNLAALPWWGWLFGFLACGMVSGMWWAWEYAHNHTLQNLVRRLGAVMAAWKVGGLKTAMGLYIALTVLAWLPFTIYATLFGVPSRTFAPDPVPAPEEEQ